MTRSQLRDAAAATLFPLLALGCAHSTPFPTQQVEEQAPYSTAIPIRLTYNPGNNYEATWTEDGRGIIYHYSILPPDRSDDRCVGVLRPDGGTRLWEMCETHREHVDSADSFESVAIGTDGRLLYMEMSTRRGSGGLSGVNLPPQTRTLWLADTTNPFQRRELLDMSSGVSIQGRFFNRLRDARWVTGNAFVALATVPPDGTPNDSVGIGVGLIRGEITTSGVTLSMIPGTEGADAYSLAEAGSTLVIHHAGSANIESVPLAGGVPAVRATMPVNPSDVTCRGTICLAGASARIWQINLASGAVAELSTRMVKPRLSPASGDVAAIGVTSSVRIQVGGPFQDLTSVFVFKGVVP